VQGHHAHDGVLSFYAVLAYPSLNEWDKRKQFVMAIKALEYKRDVANGGNRKAVPDAYRRIKNQMIVGQMNRGFRRIGRRLSAGSMAYCISLSGTKIPNEILPNDILASDGSLGRIGIAPNTVNKAAEMLLVDMAFRKKVPLHLYKKSGASEPNIKHRIWASSLPVLHLAVMLYQNVGVIFNRSNAELHDALLYLSHNNKWFGPALIHAEKLRLLLPEKVPTFVPAKAVCLLPTEDDSKAYLLPI
jgi:hypothetical protein